jgi:hypothetical protein
LRGTILLPHFIALEQSEISIETANFDATLCWGMEMRDADELQVGDRIRLSGGYDVEPKFLQGKAELLGTLSKFIPGQNENTAAVVELDSSISVDGVTGNTLVLELRYKGASWRRTNTVHIELCDFDPETKAWQHRKQGRWIESHAVCAAL